jgi:hypothetical protein
MADPAAIVESCESMERGYWRCKVSLPDIGPYWHTVRARSVNEAEKRVQRRIADRDRALEFGPYRGGKEKRTRKQMKELTETMNDE